MKIFIIIRFIPIIQISLMPARHIPVIIETAAARSNIWMLSQFVARNNEYLQKIKEDGRTELKVFPNEVLQTLKEYTTLAIEEIINTDEDSKRVYEDQQAFRKGVSQWSNLSERIYFDKLADL